MTSDIENAARLLLTSRYVTCLTGAGISVESGIRPFRGPGGLWTEFGEPPMDGYRQFVANPKALLGKNRQRRRQRPGIFTSRR